MISLRAGRHVGLAERIERPAPEAVVEVGVLVDAADRGPDRLPVHLRLVVLGAFGGEEDRVGERRVVVDVGEGRERDRVFGADPGPQRAHVAFRRRVLAFVLPLGVDHEAVGAALDGGGRDPGLGDRRVAVDERPGADAEPGGVEAFDQRGVELAPVVAAVARLDVERADPGALGAGGDPAPGRRLRSGRRTRSTFPGGRTRWPAAGSAAGGGVRPRTRGGRRRRSEAAAGAGAIRAIGEDDRQEHQAVPGTEVLLTLTSAVNTGAAIRCGRAGPSMDRFTRIGLRSPADSPLSQDPVHFRPAERAARAAVGPALRERSDARRAPPRPTWSTPPSPRPAERLILSVATTQPGPAGPARPPPA